MEHCWGKKMQQTTSEVTVLTLWNTNRTSGHLWSHPGSANNGAPYRGLVHTTSCPLLDFSAAHRDPPGGQPAELGFGGGHLIQNTLSPVPWTDPLQMQDYSSAAGDESPIALLCVDNANSRHGRQKEYTCCDTFFCNSFVDANMMSYFVTAFNPFIWTVWQRGRMWNCKWM